jgi:hypothetical protein
LFSCGDLFVEILLTRLEIFFGDLFNDFLLFLGSANINLMSEICVGYKNLIIQLFKILRVELGDGFGYGHISFPVVWRLLVILLIFLLNIV